jgi:pyridoxine 5-phosphate synthase
MSASQPLSSHPTPQAGTALSVNVNKVALLRNTRHNGLPDVVRAARLCLEAGAQGITVHPRPDQRHVRPDDVFEIAAMMKDWPGREFNVEGNPFHNLMDIAHDLSARGLPLHQCTFVPDGEGQFTSDHGWHFPDDAARLAPQVATLQQRGVRVSLFMDPHPDAMAAARATGAERVELYTESFASAWAGGDRKAVSAALSRFARTAAAAEAAGLSINAGHDLSQANLPAFLGAVPQVREVSIGHALVAEALEAGYAATVGAYLQCIAAAHQAAARA